MSSVHRSVLFSALERYGSILLVFAAMAVLSRLLSPAEFGVYAVISAILAVISASYQEIGGANYLIQKIALSAADVRTAFTVTLMFSVAVTMAVVVAGVLIARFYGQESLGTGLAVAAISFVLTPFSATITALYRREMQFGKLAVCNLIANTASMIVAILLAALHYSFMAPVWGGVAGNFVLAALLATARRDIKLFRPSLAGATEVMGFGLYSSGISLINVFYNLAPQIFLARILDFSAVGLYSRALGVTQVFDKLIGQVLGPVMMPAIFQQIGAGGELRLIYLDAIRLLTAVYWPSLAFMAIMAEPIITIWLGSSWLEIVPLVRLICIGYLALFAACLTYPVLVAAGRVHDALLSSLISLPPSLCLVFAASFWGVTWVAASMLVTLPFQAAVAIGFIAKRLGLTWSELFAALWKSALVSLMSSIAALLFAVMISLDEIGMVSGLAAGSACAAGAWLTGMTVTRHPLLEKIANASNGLWDRRLNRLFDRRNTQKIRSAEQGRNV
ncbi:oligosaccharide flippase family protein [Rhodopseudomonas sp. RCAM05734]|uniref:oligosaccharide flippase family protein n=1 Tax=Rhodopseudomonas sp. RCAM05734 TaxID=3457549 RepID=UPI0040442544